MVTKAKPSKPSQTIVEDLVAAQPLSRIEWVDPDTLHANDYNPNRVAPVEMRLLAVSIVEDGWTQPIVARSDGEIVDGFHRWTLGRTNPEVRAVAGGLVPVVRLPDVTDRSQQMMATIRHNRARGAHYVVSMAEIVAELDQFGVPRKEIQRRLGMDAEEVSRLLDRGQMTKRGRAEGFGEAWRPAYAHEVTKEDPS